MSRLKKFARSLVSGYALVGANIVYTLLSIPLALNYLSMKEFGLWASIMQMANFNMILIDLGMSGSLSRILIDHKDDRNSPAYGSVIQTGVLVLTIQAVLMAVVGSVICIWLPEWMHVPEPFWHVFRLLMIWQCVVLGVAFVGRVFSFILAAHQRYDVSNYAAIGGFAVNLLVLWLGFKCQWGLYSMLAAYVANAGFTLVYTAWAVWRLGLLPAKGYWGHPNRATFHELFFFGTDLFLLNIGQQLIASSQILVVSRSLGLEAAAVWSVAIKVFVMAQQLIYRFFDYSTGALAEMIVRGERERLKARFRDIVTLTGTSAAVVGLTLALCNKSFLQVWTPGKVSWDPLNDLLMAISFFVYASTRLHIGLTGQLKQIGRLKYIYFLEGAAFVGLGLFLAPHFGFPGIILSGIITDLIFSGIYGARRTMTYFNIGFSEFFRNWLGRPVILFVISGISAFAIWGLTRKFGAPVQLGINMGLFGALALLLFWSFGIPAHLQQEARNRFKRFWPAKARSRPDRDAGMEP